MTRPRRTPRYLAAALAVVVVAALGPPSAGARAAASPTLSPYRFVTVPGARLGYRTAGSGRPLVLIVGFSATAAEWDPLLVRLLAAKRRVIVFDNRGVATSTGSLSKLTMALMADDTAHLIRRLGLRRPDVLGWSMGGYVAQELALRHPRSLRRLVLAGTDPGGPQAVQPKPRVLRLLNDPNATPVQFLPILFPADHQAAGTAWYRRIGTQSGLLPNSLTITPATVAAQARACGPRRWDHSGGGTWSRLPRLRAPTLVADGKEDIVVPTVNSRRLARRIPHARLRLYPDAGHAFVIQRERSFARLVGRFLG